VGDIVGHETVEQREAVQPPHRDHGPRRRGRRQRRMVVVPLPQGREEPGDVGLGDLPEARHPCGVQISGVAAQVAAVGGDRVGRESAFDREVVEVTGDDPLDGGPCVQRCRQDSTSSSATAAMPCASATSGSTTCPATTFTPWARGLLPCTAAAVPWFANAIT
jgi:hypothetical protein